MILGFKPQFKSLILSGEKIHTLRVATHKDGLPSTIFTIGTKLHMATGVRTKNYDCFNEDTVKKIDYIAIYGNGDATISNGDCNFHYFKDAGKELLAKNDGFNSYSDMFDFLQNQYSSLRDRDSVDVFALIQWTNFSYWQAELVNGGKE